MRKSDMEGMSLEDKMGLVGASLGVAAGFLGPASALVYSGDTLSRLINEGGFLNPVVGATITSCLIISALGPAQAAGGYVGYYIGSSVDKVLKVSTKYINKKM